MTRAILGVWWRPAMQVSGLQWASWRQAARDPSPEATDTMEQDASTCEWQYLCQVPSLSCSLRDSVSHLVSDPDPPRASVWFRDYISLYYWDSSTGHCNSHAACLLTFSYEIMSVHSCKWLLQWNVHCEDSSLSCILSSLHHIVVWSIIHFVGCIWQAPNPVFLSLYQPCSRSAIHCDRTSAESMQTLWPTVSYSLTRCM